MHGLNKYFRFNKRHQNQYVTTAPSISELHYAQICKKEGMIKKSEEHMTIGTYQICKEIIIRCNQFRGHASFCTVYKRVFSKFIHLQVWTNIHVSESEHGIEQSCIAICSS